MKEIEKIRLNKNRGWRGLAELICEDAEGNIVHKMIFSFSQNVWNDLLKGYIVTKCNDDYYVIHFDGIERLPKPTQQRSVLIKNFTTNVVNVTRYTRDTWPIPPDYHYYLLINFKLNRNNHTNSAYNYVGVRVTVDI